jgi:hypothetical protein
VVISRQIAECQAEPAPMSHSVWDAGVSGGNQLMTETNFNRQS